MLFSTLEEELQHVFVTLQTKMKQLSALGGERKKLAIREAESEFEEGNDLIRQMQNYMRQSNTPNLQTKITQYKNELNRLQRDFNRAVKSGGTGNARDQLLGGGGGDDYDSRSANQRTYLLRDQQRLEDTTDRLMNTTRVAHQTEEIGVNILSDLDDQSASLVRTKGHLGDVDENIGQARKIVRAIKRRVIYNKMILVLIVVLMTAAIGLIVYLKWFAQPFNATPAPTPAPTMTPTPSPTAAPTTPAPTTKL